MRFETVLRQLVSTGGLRKVARDLGIDHASLYKSIQDGSNVGLDRIEAILNLFGMELKAVKRKGVNRGSRKNENQKQSKHET
jgi:DNA-binding phage protein